VGGSAKLAPEFPIRRIFVRRFAAAVAGAFLLCPTIGSAWADTVKFTADLAPAGDKAAAAKGTATLSLDTASKTLTWSVDYSGLSKPPEMAGFLAPGAKADDDPDMVPVDLPKDTKSPIKGSTALNDAQVTGIQKGDWVLLIGTTEAPEIGGEVKKTP
jgi:hypothetical protein